MKLHHVCKPCFVRTYYRALPSVVHSQPTDADGTCDCCGVEHTAGFRVDDVSLNFVKAAKNKTPRF